MRWLNRDPIEKVGGVNLYRTIGNNTLCLYDAVGFIEVTDIPPIMRANKCDAAAQLMEKWLASPVNSTTHVEPLGSFSGTYTITTDSRTCTKKLKMKLDNKWSLKSLTRNPFSDKSILPKSILELGSRFWEDIAQEYYYNVIEPIPNQRH